MAHHPRFTEKREPDLAELLDQHVALQAELRQLSAMLEEPARSEGEVARQLQAVLRLLLEHFEHEEESGCFTEAAAAAPWMSERVDALLAEHASLAAELRELSAGIAGDEGAAGSAAGWRDSLKLRFHDFHRRFSEHEGAENALLQEAHGHDIGAKD